MKQSQYLNDALYNLIIIIPFMKQSQYLNDALYNLIIIIPFMKQRQLFFFVTLVPILTQLM